MLGIIRYCITKSERRKPYRQNCFAVHGDLSEERRSVRLTEPDGGHDVRVRRAGLVQRQPGTGDSLPAFVILFQQPALP